MYSLETLQRTFIRSDASKAEEAALMKTNICNKKFLVQLCGIVDIYKINGTLVNNLAVVYCLSHE